MAGRHGVSRKSFPENSRFSAEGYKEEQYRKLAGILRENLDMDRIYGILDRRL